YDPAGFTYPDGRGGVEQPAVGHARKLGTEEFEQVEDLLSGGHLSSGQVVYIGSVDPGDAGCVDPPHPGFHGLEQLHAAPWQAVCSVPMSLLNDRFEGEPFFRMFRLISGDGLIVDVPDPEEERHRLHAVVGVAAVAERRPAASCDVAVAAGIHGDGGRTNDMPPLCATTTPVIRPSSTIESTIMLCSISSTPASRAISEATRLATSGSKG